MRKPPNSFENLSNGEIVDLRTRKRCHPAAHGALECTSRLTWLQTHHQEREREREKEFRNREIKVLVSKK